MKKLLLLFFIIASTCFAQSNYNLISTIPFEGNFFASDIQGNVYVVAGNELIKYEKSGKELYRYSNKNLGIIEFVDASNMLKIVLFYKNFSHVVFLDNTLSPTAEPVNLFKIGFRQAQLVCSSHSNGIWLYDQQNFELVRIGQNLEKTYQTGNLDVLLNLDLQPDYLLEYDNKVYLNNPLTGILIFDIYGTFYKTLPIKNVHWFQPIGDWVYYISDKKAKAYNLKTTEEKQFEMPLSEFQSFSLAMGVLLLQTSNFIYIYSKE